MIWNYVEKNTVLEQKRENGVFFFLSLSFRHVKYPYSSFTHKLLGG